MRESANSFDAVVVGGGLAGLTAAALIAETGQRVGLFEKSDVLGGRAVTHVKNGFHLNLGPHAWYPGGPGTQVLSRLGISVPGRAPRPAGAFAFNEGRLHTLPIGFVSLLTTDLLGLHGKLEVARLLARLPRMDTGPFDSTPLVEWLAGIGNPMARALVNMFIRVAMYANAPDVMSAGAGLASLQSVLRDNVWYLDNGWQSIVNALWAKAVAVGVQVMRDAPVREVLHDGCVRGVRLDDGKEVDAASVVLAVAPPAAKSLLPSVAQTTLAQWDGVPSRAACLDVGLARLPKPRNVVAFGVDRPLYYSVHSATASLAPGGAAVIHVAKYLDSSAVTDPKADEKDVEGFLDILQPGWRTEVVVQRFLPSMTVINAIPTATRGGLDGRPSVGVRDVPGLYIAGDWVGAHGTLANAAVASAARAARRSIDRTRNLELGTGNLEGAGAVA
jgi:phytoene dehydrogenase-like protein